MRPEKAKNPKHPGGRHSKLTPELQAQMFEHFKLGMSARRVCDLLNVGESTFFRWVRLGQAQVRIPAKLNAKIGPS